jgi:hypothetical protein
MAPEAFSSSVLLCSGMADKEKIPARSMVWRVIMAIIAIWLIIWMLRISGIHLF